MPSCPWLLAPQHCAVALSVSAQVWLSPVTTAVASAPPASRIITGVAALEQPNPHWPRLLSPQHCTTLLVVRAHVCFSPAATLVGQAAPESVTNPALFLGP